MGLRANPTYRQRRFGVEVRRLRDKAGLSTNDAAALLGMRQSQLSVIEAGRTGLSAERLRTLADAAGPIDHTFVASLIDLGSAPGKGWWSQYRDRLRPAFLDFAELESMASVLLNYEPLFVPGLLQTPAYATVVNRDGYAEGVGEDWRSAVEFRKRRQEVLVEPDPPRFHAIIHEAALRSSFGSREMMREQLLHLIEASRLPHVTIQVLPLDGPVPFGTSFTLFEPLVPELSTIYVPHVEESLYLGDAEAIDRYRRLFARLREVALPPVDATVQPEAQVAKDSLGLIQRLLYPLL